MNVYSPPTAKSIVYLFSLSPSLSVSLSVSPSLTRTVYSKSSCSAGEAMQPAPIRRQWCAELCSPPLNAAVNLVWVCVYVCSLQTGFSICPQSIVYSVHGAAQKDDRNVFLSLHPLCLSISLLCPLLLTITISLTCPPGLSLLLLTSPSAAQDRWMYGTRGHRIFTETTAKCIQKLLVSQTFHSAVPFQLIQSCFHVSLSIFPYCLALISACRIDVSSFQREREKRISNISDNCVAEYLSFTKGYLDFSSLSVEFSMIFLL